MSIAFNRKDSEGYVTNIQEKVCCHLVSRGNLISILQIFLLSSSDSILRLAPERVAQQTMENALIIVV